MGRRNLQEQVREYVTPLLQQRSAYHLPRTFSSTIMYMPSSSFPIQSHLWPLHSETRNLNFAKSKFSFRSNKILQTHHGLKRTIYNTFVCLVVLKMNILTVNQLTQATKYFATWIFACESVIHSICIESIILIALLLCDVNAYEMFELFWGVFKIVVNIKSNHLHQSLQNSLLQNPV